MTRRLIVMRHAKSSWSDEAMSDHDRPLNKRGRRDGKNVGRKLRELGWVPDFVLSSDSRRTRETYDRLTTGWQCQPVVTFSGNLYHAGYSEVLEELPAIETQVRTLLLLGHNPGWQALATKLSGTPITLRTATTVLLGSEGEDWTMLLRNPWRLERILEPRELAGEE